MRKIKILKFNYDELVKNTVEKKINKEMEELQNNGGKIITTFQNCMGLSPVLLVFSIVYDTKD